MVYTKLEKNDEWKSEGSMKKKEARMMGLVE
jgi:hypothetical protein